MRLVHQALRMQSHKLQTMCALVHLQSAGMRPFTSELQSLPAKGKEGEVAGCSDVG